MSRLRIAMLFLILIGGLILVVFVTAGYHELRAAFFGFIAGVLVARLFPPLWRWAHRREA